MAVAAASLRAAVTAIIFDAKNQLGGGSATDTYIHII